jgi:hypothetical protein
MRDRFFCLNALRTWTDQRHDLLPKYVTTHQFRVIFLKLRSPGNVTSMVQGEGHKHSWPQGDFDQSSETPTQLITYVERFEDSFCRWICIVKIWQTFLHKKSLSKLNTFVIIYNTYNFFKYSKYRVSRGYMKTPKTPTAQKPRRWICF